MSPHPPLPERVLQFGTGRFLRGFADAFIHAANVGRGGGQPAGRLVVVESTGSGTAGRLAAQGCRYPLLERGIQGGARVDTVTEVASISRALDARSEWPLVLDAARSPDLRLVISNVTEAGYAAEGDSAAGGRDAPASFPARLLAVLAERARADQPGLVLLPCELVERNGDRLRDLVAAEAARQRLERPIVERVADGNAWGVTLVDRIVTSPGPDALGGGGDPLAVAAEPFASWAVEIAPDAPLVDHPAIVRVADVGPYALRKIRVLNGAHTALVARCRGTSLALVREAMEEPAIAGWLEALLLDEVVPALGDRVEDGAGFARVVLERFRNPFLDHRLSDIALHHATKLRTRLLPTYRDHVARLGRPPERLTRLLQQEGVLD